MTTLSNTTRPAVLLAATILVAMAIGATGLWTQVALRRADDEMRGALVGRALVERINGLVYAVVMDSRGIYMSRDPRGLEKFAAGMATYLDRLTADIAEGKSNVSPTLRQRFETLEKRVGQFREFRLELARRGRVAGHEAARDFGDNEANRSIRTALNKDLEALADALAEQASAAADRRDRIIDHTWRLNIGLVVFAGLAGLLGLLTLPRRRAAGRASLPIAERITKPSLPTEEIARDARSEEARLEIPAGIGLTA